MMDISAFEEELEKLRSGFAFDTTKLCGMYVAALARAEAAEALAYERLEAALFAEQERDDAEKERDDANLEVALEQANARNAWCRVAELEARLAAQQWRPGSETPPPDWYQTVETIEGVFSHTYFDGASWHGYYDNLPPLWYRPIPPLPQEPTP